MLIDLEITVLTISFLLSILLVLSTIKYLMSDDKGWYMITVEYTKYPNKRFFRSQQHNGTKVNNQFVQFSMFIGDRKNIVRDIKSELSKEIPVLSNWKIISIERI